MSDPENRAIPRTSRIEPLPSGLAAALAEPGSYREDPSASRGVEAVETHISHVFLTGSRVYKLRKAVDLGFVSFASRAERNEDCARELQLNRRLAPDVYLGLAPVLEDADGFGLGSLADGLVAGPPGGEAPEHCVVMRRLPAGRDALSMLDRGDLQAGHLEAVAVKLARFHAGAGLGVPAPFAPEAWLARIVKPVEDNFSSLREALGSGVPESAVALAEARAEAFVARHGDRFEARRRAGRAVDGHGDLHLQHVWFERTHSEPLLIDCLEFREDLRKIDAASEVAFLAMDLVYRGGRRLADAFLASYARESDDFDLYAVVDFYAAYRAAVRAKVAAVVVADEENPPERRRAAEGSVRRHLALAAELLGPPGPGALIALCGLVGTGKSSVAEALAEALGEALGGVVISSDRLRKRLAGLDPAAPAGEAWDAGLYAPERKHAIYRALVERCEPVLASGRVAIVDASFASRARRTELREFADERGVPVFLIEVRCAEAVTLARLARRADRGRDASDAGPELHHAFARAFEPPEEWPAATRVVIDSDAGDWRRRVQAFADRLREGLGPPRPGGPGSKGGG